VASLSQSLRASTPLLLAAIAHTLEACASAGSSRAEKGGEKAKEKQPSAFSGALAPSAIKEGPFEVLTLLCKRGLLQEAGGKEGSKALAAVRRVVDATDNAVLKKAGEKVLAAAAAAVSAAAAGGGNKAHPQGAPSEAVGAALKGKAKKAKTTNE